jgi:hypothetical protein
LALPTDAKERKDTPLFSGVLKYFPDALAYVAKVSKAGNDQHNPGKPLHWSRGKSGDHEDCAARHLLESGTVDSDGLRHSGKLAWRALAILQLELEAEREVKPLVPSDNVADVKQNDENNKALFAKQLSCQHNSAYVLNGDRFCTICLAPLDKEPIRAKVVYCGTKQFNDR